MPYLFQHFGVAIGAVTGVLAGAGKKIDLFGVMVLAAAGAMGGGTVRDLLLGNRQPSLIFSPQPETARKSNV